MGGNGKSKENVMIGILAGDNRVNVSIAGALFNLPFLSGDDSNRFIFLPWICAGYRPQEFARNTIIEKFLSDPGGDTLIMIDNDMILHGHDTLLKLLDTPDYDIAGPLQLMGFRHDTRDDAGNVTGQPKIYPVCGMYDRSRPAGKRFVPVLPVNGEKHTQVDIVGSGIMAIKRRVLEDPRMQIEPGMSPPAIFRNVYEANGNRTRGLDVDFCVRARELGYRVVVNWSATSGHFKDMDLYEIEVYAKQQFMLGVEARERDAIPLADGASR